MATNRSYHRPANIDAALALLGRNDVTTAVLGGGTSLNARAPREPVELVDLQGLGLDGIALHGGTMIVGAMVRLQDLVEHPATPLLVAEAATREGPNTLRNAATVGGTIGSRRPDSELLAALLVHETIVSSTGPGGTSDVALADALADPETLDGRIITEIRLATEGIGHIARTGRTPADRAIVAAVGRRSDEGRIAIALTGVADSPILAHESAIAALNPPGDFRGSPAYRRELAATLAGRVVAALGDAS
jgi:CO/xanthine dehydrogenase FAD-binding subunit